MQEWWLEKKWEEMRMEVQALQLLQMHEWRLEKQEWQEMPKELIVQAAAPRENGAGDAAPSGQQGCDRRR